LALGEAETAGDFIVMFVESAAGGDDAKAHGFGIRSGQGTG
jgi:hypothetical protein